MQTIVKPFAKTQPFKKTDPIDPLTQVHTFYSTSRPRQPTEPRAPGRRSPHQQSDPHWNCCCCCPRAETAGRSPRSRSSGCRRNWTCTYCSSPRTFWSGSWPTGQSRRRRGCRRLRAAGCCIGAFGTWAQSPTATGRRARLGTRPPPRHPYTPKCGTDTRY